MANLYHQEILRVQLRAVKPTLDRIFAMSKESGIAQVYPSMAIARDCKHLKVHLRDGEPQAQTAREFELGC
jgi:hypothetical protein